MLAGVPIFIQFTVGAQFPLATESVVAFCYGDLFGLQ